MATIKRDQPGVQPLGTVDIIEDKLYIQTGKSKDVSKQMAQNPKVELSVFDSDRWIRVAATMVEDDRCEVK